MKFLKNAEIKRNPVCVNDFWLLPGHEIPSGPGAYILLSNPEVKFTYPDGKSSVFYIGMATNLKSRLEQHLKYSKEARDDRKLTLYWPRYEYMAKFGGRYTFVETWQGMKPKALEDILLSTFAKHYKSFPTANGAGSWTRLVQG